MSPSPYESCNEGPNGVGSLKEEDIPFDINTGSDYIALVGMSCRLPGGINSAGSLYEFLQAGRSGQCDIPPDRFNSQGFYHPNGLNRPGSMTTSGGYFLQEDPRLFDNEFFDLMPLEAQYMDPHQRKLLEVVYEAFESAGVTLDAASGANVGCYVGSFSMDYQTIQNRDPEYYHRYVATGMGTAILGNRISHVFNLKGPSMVLDTACSSSLYALHLACTALNNRECDAAVVAGASLILAPQQQLATVKAGILSATSTCHTFSTDADGYGRAEGVGCLLIKRLSDAIKNNDPIRAVIPATAVNANGRTPGITHPSSIGQERVIRKAYEKAGFDFDDTTYVECHGTGTPVGDPIEVQGISSVFHDRDKPLLLGSVKTNLGHSEAASGITSIMKAALAMENGYIPATIGVGTVNPSIKLKDWNLEIVTKAVPWPSSHGGTSLRRAGVNSFGYGGANAHAIIQSVDILTPTPSPGADNAQDCHRRSRYLIPISAKSAESLEARVQQLKSYLTNGHKNVVDLAYTLGVRRTHFPYRTYLVADHSSLTSGLGFDEIIPTSKRAPDAVKNVVFVFTGQGAQWPQMGRGLYEEFPNFATTVDRLDSYLQSLPHPPGWSLKEAMSEHKATSKIHDADRSQPVCTAIQVALVILFRSWGIFPTLVVGHSSGEIAAAFAAGRLSLFQAMITAYYRGYTVKTFGKRDGAMMAVGLPAAEAASEIEKIDQAISLKIACVNSPESVTISGDALAVDVLLASLHHKGILARILPTDGRAYHSHHMAIVGFHYEQLLSQIYNCGGYKPDRSHSPKWISSVTGEEKVDDPDPAYWRANLESSVEFSDAMGKAMTTGAVQIVEIGPHSTLRMPINQIRNSHGISTEAVSYVSALSRNSDDIATVLDTIGQLFLQGHRIVWDKVNDSETNRAGVSGAKVLPDLPSYPWTYGEVMWHESRESSEFRYRKYPRHELLGSLVPGGDGIKKMWHNKLRLDDVTWLCSHKLDGSIVVPGAAYISMIVEAANQVVGILPQRDINLLLENVNILAALPISEGNTVELFTTLQPAKITSSTLSKKSYDFNIVSYEAGAPVTRATGTVMCNNEDCEQIKPKCDISADLLVATQARTWYDHLSEVGLQFGSEFQSIREVRISRRRNKPVCSVRVPLLRGFDDGTEPEYVLHPVTIDAMIQAALIATSSGLVRDLNAKVPVSFGSLIVHVPKGGLDTSTGHSIISTTRRVGFEASRFTAELRDSTGNVLCQMNEGKLAAYNTGSLEPPQSKRQPMMRVRWMPDPLGLGLISGTQFFEYINKAMSDLSLHEAGRETDCMGALLDLFIHKMPGLRVLELQNDALNPDNAQDEVSNYLRFQTSTVNWTLGFIKETGELYTSVVNPTDSPTPLATPFTKSDDQSFDLVLISSRNASDIYYAPMIARIKNFLERHGVILYSASSLIENPLDTQGFATTDFDLDEHRHIIIGKLGRTRALDNIYHNTLIYVVDRSRSQVSQQFVLYIKRYVSDRVIQIDLDEISEHTIGPGSIVFSFIETERPLLSTIAEDDLYRLQQITNNAAHLVWVTSSKLLTDPQPESGLVFGLGRAIMMEQPAMKFYVFDIDDPSAETFFHNLVSVLSQDTDLTDYEFVQSRGTVHVSRFVPDNELNTGFRQRYNKEAVTMPLGEVSPAKLAIKRVGNLDTLHFQPVIPRAELGPGEVQVAVKCIGLNAKDYYAFAGKVDTEGATCSLEHCGVVERVGNEVSHLARGDRVVVMAPGHFQTREIVPYWACQKLLDNESFDVMCTMPIVFSTAIYALRDRARLQRGESVLIHSAAGGVGNAAIQIAQDIGAKIFATVSSEEKVLYISERFGIPRNNIYNSRDESFLPKILEATGGRGVDVVLNSLTGEILHAGWKCCAPFGRFVEIGKRDMTEFGKLDMAGFLQSRTFTAFDLSDIFYDGRPEYQELWAQLLCRTLELFRSGRISSVEPMARFNAAQISDAMRHFASRDRTGKVVVSLEDQNAQVATSLTYSTNFHPDKTYLMVGCLGGLGRSLSKWMVSRGARKFVFLGRSGLAKPAARSLVSELELLGAICTVVQGDVCNRADVKTAVSYVEGKIGGVVQAAMGLQEALFTTMTHGAWHRAVAPKVLGTWHIHNSIKGKDDELDFFLMTSSVSGSIGTATESNYCSASFFLDLFARYRRSMGVPATSIGLGMISEVGYLHENPGIEAILRRHGIHPMNEDEMLLVVDGMLSKSQRRECVYDELSSCHVLTGMETLGLEALRNDGFDITNMNLDDPRTAYLSQGVSHNTGQNSHDRFPAEIMSGLEAGRCLHDLIKEHIMKRFSSLVLLPREKVDVEKSLSDYGMDSMIAAEFRTWFYQVFHVDVPFLDLLDNTVSLASLAQRVVQQVS